MKHFAILLLFLFYYSQSHGQICDGPVTLNSQSEVDNFDQSCVQINGTLIISGPDITDLSPLSNLTLVCALRIFNNPQLISLTGLQNIEYICFISPDTGLSISDNPILTDLSALENLSSMYKLNISGNNALTDLTPLGGIELLQDFGALGPVNLWITENANLTTLEGFNPIYEGNFEIRDNPLLSICSVNFVCDVIMPGPSQTIIENNASGCMNYDEVAFGCGLGGFIEYEIFQDLNENGIQENNEPLWPLGSVTINDVLAYGNSVTSSYFVPYGNYTIDYNTFPYWELTTSPSSYSVDISSSNPVTAISFGIRPTDELSNNFSHMTYTPTRCNEWTEFTITVTNNATLPTNYGTVWFQYDEEITDFEFVDPPDQTASPNIFGWDYTDLFPGQSLNKSIRLKIPGPPDFEIGDEITLGTWVNFGDTNSDEFETPLVEYDALVLCSYDPNDKLVLQHYENNQALFTDPLQYTIRFQNTGNAEAQRVRIVDELDSNLDLSSFRVLSSSHEEFLTTTLDGKTATFDFNNIMLPDSTTNFEESQGYVAFSIMPVDGLPDPTIINNFAGIYFDFNPPIITNTTETILTNEIMINQIEVESNPFKVFPNPATDFIEIEIPNNTNAIIELRDTKGSLLKKSTVNDTFYQLDMINVNSGLYFLYIQSNEKTYVEKIVVAK